MAGLADLLKMFTGGATEAPAQPTQLNPPARRNEEGISDKEANDARDADRKRQFWLAGIGVPEGGIPDVVRGYRADPKGKYGGKEGLETLPTEFGGPELYARIRAMRLGEEYGVPQLTPEQLAALALKEGMRLSGVFGVNSVWDEGAKTLLDYDPHMAGDKELFDALMERGIPELAAAFAVRLANKDKLAKRLGIPFETAWQGTGATPYEPKGAYADSMKHFYKAATAEPNRALVDFIRSAYGEPATKASGGVVIDDGNPAKRRRLI